MNRLFITALACLINVSMVGQGWEQPTTFGGENEDGGNSVLQTTDGGFIITGYTWDGSGYEYEVYLIKTNNTGTEQWSQTYNFYDSNYFFSDERGYSVQQTSDGGFIITGEAYSISNGDWLYLIKTDNTGTEQWKRLYYWVSRGHSVQQTSDGGYIITGQEDIDVILMKTDENGEDQWLNYYFTSSDQSNGYSVQQTSDGGYIITGSAQIGAYHYVHLIKTDNTGTEQWSQTYGGGAGILVQQTSDGGYIIAGHTGSFGNGGADVYLIKTDNTGTEQWSQTFGGTDNDFGRSVQQTSDGGYIIAGWTHSFGNGGSDVYLIKTDNTGTEQWSQTFGGENEDSGHSVQQTTDGGYIIAGRTRSFGNGGADVYLIKTDSEGTLSSSFTIPTPSNRKLERVVDVLGREVNHTTNQILFHIYDDGSVEKKFVVE